VKTQIFYQNQRKINTLSNLLDNFDENYDSGIGLRDSIIDIIETRNLDVPEARKVSDEAVFSVAERALVASATLPTDVQHFNVIREVTNFVTFAFEGGISEAVTKHSDLLPVSHPNSTAPHEFSIPELRQLRATWIAADSRISDENARAIVAAVYGSNPNSLDFHYNMIRLNSLGDQIPSDLRIMPIIAFGDPYAGKNSFWHRKMRAEGQRRDEEGQFAEMGGGARLYVRMPMGNIISVVGKVAGIPENDPKGIDIEITDVPGITPGIYTVPSDMTKFFKAILPAEAIKKSSPVGPGLNVNFIDIADMVRKDLPTSWFESTGGTTVPGLSTAVRAAKNYATGDGYRVSMFDGPSEALQKRVEEAQGKFGSLVVNTKGTDALESDKPVYELISTKRGQEEVVGYAQDWAAIQAMAKNEDENYPDSENEPIVETVEQIATLPEEEPTLVPEVSGEDFLDNESVPTSDPYDTLPNNWILTGQNGVFLSKDSMYSVVYSDAAIGSELQEDLDLETGLPSYREAPVSIAGAMSIYDEANGELISIAFNWDDVEKFIQSYEQDEDDVVVNRMSYNDRQKEPVQVDQLDPKRFELLEIKDEDVRAGVEKAKKDKRYADVWDNPIGQAGVNEGVIYPEFKQPLLYPINKILQTSDVDSRAVDMVDEMLDYPQNFTVGQMATLYYNLKKYPKYEGNYSRANAFGFGQDRQKMRLIIAEIESYKLADHDFIQSKQDLIDNYRFIGHVALQNLRHQLNEYINANTPRVGEEKGEAIVFKDRLSVLAKDILPTDAILDVDGTILEIERIAEDEDDPDLLDIYVKRGESVSYYTRDNSPIRKDDSIVVFRGTGMLPTPENLKLAEKIAKGLRSEETAGAPSDGSLITDSNDPRVIIGKKDASEIASQDAIRPAALAGYKAVLAEYVITDAATFYRLEQIIENPENYEWSTVQQFVRSIRGTYEKRPQGEYGAQKKLRELLKLDVQLREVPEDQVGRILRNLHTYDRSTAEQLHQDLQNKPRRSGISFVDGEIVLDPTLPDTSAEGIVRARKEKDFRDSDFTIIWQGQELVLTTSLTGPDAPKKATIAKAAQVINNYFVDADNPLTLQSFVELHRKLPKDRWANLIETWGQPQFSKYDRPEVFRDALPEDQGGPRNRQLASVARAFDKGLLPDYFVDWVMQNFKGKPLAWFAKILDVTKVLENNYDREILGFGMRNLKDVTGLRIPDNHPKVPDAYQAQDGAVITPEEFKIYQDRFINAFAEYMRRMYANDPFWQNILPNLLPGQESAGTGEIEKTPVETILARAARLSDGRKTRRRMSRVKAELEKALGLSNRELSTDGKRFVLQAISELEYLKNALNGNRKNNIQRSPADFDRRLKLITSALANRPVANSYGRLRNPSENTKNNLENLASLVSTLVGTYQAGQSPDPEDVVVDRRRVFESSVPRMERFVPPAFEGPALDGLTNASTWEEVKEFIGKLVLYVFDFETTGIFDVNDPGIKNDPIQLAIAKATNYKIESMYNAYINPESKLSAFTLKTIGDGTGKKVTKEFLSAQRSKLQAMKEFLDTVPSGAVLVGHNGLMFDMEVLNRTLKEAGLPEYEFGGFIDTYGLSTHVMPRWSREKPDAPFKLADYGQYGAQQPSDTLESLVTYFGLSNNGRHEADADIISTLEILEKILDFAIAGRGDRGKVFDFFASKNAWSREAYEKAQEDYKQAVTEYTMSRFAFNVSMAMENLNVSDAQGAEAVSEDVLNQILDIAKRPVVGMDDDRTADLPSARIVNELGSSSYVVDNNTGRVGRSYGSTGNGLVLAEFRAADYLTTARKVLEKIQPSALYNATEALIVKGGNVLDYGMTVSHPSAGKDSGVFQGFEDINVGLIKVGNSLYRVPVKEISVLKYKGSNPASPEQVDKTLDLIESLSKLKGISSSFAKALKKTIDSDSYPSGSMADLISMLVNLKNERSLVDANSDTPSALPNSQSAASSVIDDPIVDRRKVNKNVITKKDVEKVKIDTSLIEKNMPGIQLNDEVTTILKAFAALADPKHKGKSLNKEHYNLVIRAYAGTGKTTTMEALTWLASAMRPNDYILYLVFGRENAEEADISLNAGNTMTSTLHALAYNVDANQHLKTKFNKQPELTGKNEGLNITYAPERIAEAFGIYDQFFEAIKERYGENAEIDATLLAELAYDGMEKWAMSADREMSAKHFTKLRSYLSELPSWGPKRTPEEKAAIERGENFDFGDYLVPELIEIAQLFWQDIISPLDQTRPQLLVDFQHMVKNWSLGNVDFTSTKKDSSGNLVNALGLDRTPSILLLDEGQDMNPVFIDIMSRQATQYDNGIQIVTVGDSYQSIFGFSGNQDALQEVPSDASFPLSVSYRAAPELLTPINNALDGLGAPDRLKTAVDDIGFIVPNSTLLQLGMWIITRSNAGIMDAAAKMEATDLFQGKPFAVTANFKKRMLNHINALRYLSLKYKLESDIKKLEDAAIAFKQDPDVNVSVYDEETETWRVETQPAGGKNYEENMKETLEKVAIIKEELKNLRVPANRPGVLIGATWEGLMKKALEDRLDSDTAILWKLSNREKYEDADGKLRKMSKYSAFGAIRNRLQAYRVFNKYISLPEEIGKAGYLGSNIAYVVKNGNLVIADGGGFPKGKKPGDFGMGVSQNSKILESIGFTRSEEVDETTGERKWEWVRALRNNDQSYIDSEVTEVSKALSGEDAELTLMTGHTSKGLENEAVRLWEDWDPRYIGNAPSESSDGIETMDKEEKAAKTKEQIEKELKKLKEMLEDSQEPNLHYTVLSRPQRILDMGGLGKMYEDKVYTDLVNKIKNPTDPDDDGGDPIVNKRTFSGQGDYYDKANKDKVERAESYLKSLNKEFSTPKMQRIVPFKYASDSDIEFEIQQTISLIKEVENNPEAGRMRDENSRFGLLEILAMIESGASISTLSSYDRQRLFAYLGSSSLGSSSALLDDPTEKIRGAISELNRRLGIE
jgi:DNA polymerase III epsilon subunit-like protein